jgi:AcrR family transcriptional regulator
MDREVETPRTTPGRSPGVRSRELRAQGMRTRTMIVRAATKVLLESGGFDFTLRAVARQAKISVSNLQYYFPDREQLLRAVMAPVIDAYMTQLDQALHGSVPPRDALDGLFARQLQDVKDSKTRTLWTHFAALSMIDPECARLYDEWYNALVKGLGQLIAKVNPATGPAGSVQLAALLISMGDGLGFLLARSGAYTRELDASFLTMVNFLLKSPPSLGQGKTAGR